MREVISGRKWEVQIVFGKENWAVTFSENENFTQIFFIVNVKDVICSVKLNFIVSFLSMLWFMKQCPILSCPFLSAEGTSLWPCFNITCGSKWIRIFSFSSFLLPLSKPGHPLPFVSLAVTWHLMWWYPVGGVLITLLLSLTFSVSAGRALHKKCERDSLSVMILLSSEFSFCSKNSFCSYNKAFFFFF